MQAIENAKSSIKTAGYRFCGGVCYLIAHLCRALSMRCSANIDAAQTYRPAAKFEASPRTSNSGAPSENSRWHNEAGTKPFNRSIAEKAAANRVSSAFSSSGTGNQVRLSNHISHSIDLMTNKRLRYGNKRGFESGSRGGCCHFAVGGGEPTCPLDGGMMRPKEGTNSVNRPRFQFWRITPWKDSYLGIWAE